MATPISKPAVKPAVSTVAAATVKPPKYKAPLCDIAWPPRLNRPLKSSDLIVNKGWDGKTEKQTVDQIMKHLDNNILPENVAFVRQQAGYRYKDLAIALNNAFSPATGNPTRTLIDKMKAANVTVLASLTNSQAITYQFTDKAGGKRYFARDLSGNLNEVKGPPANVVITADLKLTDPIGLIQKYPTWTNKGLSKPLVTITEL